MLAVGGVDRVVVLKKHASATHATDGADHQRHSTPQFAFLTSGHLRAGWSQSLVHTR